MVVNSCIDLSRSSASFSMSLVGSVVSGTSSGSLLNASTDDARPEDESRRINNR